MKNDSKNNISDDEERVFFMPEIFDFEVDENYDYARDGIIATVWYYTIRTVGHVLLFAYNRLMFGLKIEGLHNVFALRGGAVIVCNHVHPMDCTFIDSVMQGRRVYYATLETNFKIPVARHLMRWLGGVPVPKSIHMLGDFSQEMQHILKNGGFVCMYPEGILYPYYKGLRKFRSGAFRLAAECSSPVLPFAITFREPHGIYRLYKRKPCVTLTVLEPIQPSGTGNIRDDADTMMQACRERMGEAVNCEK